MRRVGVKVGQQLEVRDLWRHLDHASPISRETGLVVEVGGNDAVAMFSLTPTTATATGGTTASRGTA